MFRRFSVNYAILSLVLDIAFTTTALAFAETIRPSLSALSLVAELPDYQIPIIWYVVVPFIWGITLLLASVYERSRVYRLVDEVAVLVFAVGVAALLCAGLFYLSFRTFSRALFVLFVVSNLGLLLGWRLVARILFRVRSNPAAERRVLVVGTGRSGQRVGAMLTRHYWMGLQLAGFLETDQIGEEPAVLEHAVTGRAVGEEAARGNDREPLEPFSRFAPPPENEAGDLKVLGPLSQLEEVVRQNRVDDVVIALPQRAYGEVNKLVMMLHDLPVQVRVVPDYFSLALYRAKAEDFGGLPMINLKDPALSDFQRLMKRLFDLMLGGLLVLINVPLYLMIAVAIKLDSAGPVIFRQERVGENGRVFKMFKFRTMIPGAEAMQEEVNVVNGHGELIHKRPDDPRITRMGHFLRRTSLDELPQLFNVLLGDMSLVGPRPEIPWMIEQYEPWQHKRFAVPQGITGWWQINGRSERMMHLHTEDDLYYIQNYSLWMDIYILLKTPLVVMKGKGAY